MCTYIVKANDDLRQVRNDYWLGQGVGCRVVVKCLTSFACLSGAIRNAAHNAAD
jgi:hypothetical protein